MCSVAGGCACEVSVRVEAALADISTPDWCTPLPPLLAACLWLHRCIPICCVLHRCMLHRCMLHRCMLHCCMLHRCMLQLRAALLHVACCIAACCIAAFLRVASLHVASLHSCVLHRCGCIGQLVRIGRVVMSAPARRTAVGDKATFRAQHDLYAGSWRAEVRTCVPARTRNAQRR